MKYLNLPKPHGFLLWRGKQTAIASTTPLAVGEKMLVISDGEAFGEVTLSQPVAVNLSGFEELSEYHCIRPEDRKLYWPDADSFYVHRLKAWQPYEGFREDGKRVLPAKAIKMNGNEAELIDLPEPTEDQKRLLEQVERLPKTLILLDEAVTLEDGKAVCCDGVDGSKLEPILKATLDGTKSADSLALYQLALVRIPRLMFRSTQAEEKKSEDTADKADGGNMPYEKVKRGDEWCVIGPDTEKCYGDEGEADDYLAALRLNAEADEDKSLKELIAEARKCYDSGMAMPVIVSGPTTFADLQALEDAREQARETEELTWQFQMLSSNILNSPEIDDKAAALSALAGEYGTLVKQAISEKALAEDSKAGEGYLVSGEEGDHLPTKRNGKPDRRLMGAAWAALHGGYRGNKYEGPGKQEAIRKLTALYKSESMDTPGNDDEKAGKRVRSSMMAKLKTAWETLKEFMDWAEPQEEPFASFGKGIAVKMADGDYWHFAWSTNAFEDREGEIFSTKSLEKYVEEAEKQDNRGYFNFWHIPDSDFAEIKWQGVVGRFLVEAGPYLQNEKGQSARKFFIENPDGHPDIAPKGWGSSPEYRYLPEERKSGVYENIWKTRTSTLPRVAAANIWTKGTTMALTAEQAKAAKAIFGEDLASKIISGAEAATKELEEAGVAHKEATAETTVEVTTEKTVVDFSLEDVVEAVAKRVTPDMQPFADALGLMAQQLQDIQGQVKSLEKSKALSEEKELPRFVFQMKRASEAKETEVAEGDGLNNNKPVETQVQDKSGAAAFFPARG